MWEFRVQAMGFAAESDRASVVDGFTAEAADHPEWTIIGDGFELFEEEGLYSFDVRVQAATEADALAAQSALITLEGATVGGSDRGAYSCAEVPAH